MTMRRLAGALAGCLAGLLLAGGTPTGVMAQTGSGVTEMKFPHIGSTNSSYQWVAVKFAELIGKKTGGKVHITVIPGGQMGDQQDLLAGLRLGTIDFYVNDVGTMAFQDAGKQFNVLYAPYLFADQDQFIRFVHSDVYARMVADYESKSGVKVLPYVLDRSPRQLTTRDTPVHAMKDAKGLKNPHHADPALHGGVQGLGHESTVMPWIEAVSALRQGAVDGQDNGIDIITGFKLWESQKYYMRTAHVRSGLVLFTSAKKWQQWTPEFRQQVIDAANETFVSENPKLWALETSGLEEMKSHGMTVIDPDLTEFRAAAIKEAQKFDGDLWPKGLLELHPGPEVSEQGRGGDGAATAAVRLLQRLRDLLEAALFWMGATLLAIITVIVGLQIFFRYVLNNSLAWSDEASRLVLVWMVCLGAGLASLRGQHLRIAMLEARIPAVGGRIVRTVSAVLTAWFMWVVVAGNVDVIEVRKGIPFTSIPLSSVYLSYAVTVAAMLMALGTVVDLVAPRGNGGEQTWS